MINTNQQKKSKLLIWPIIIIAIIFLLPLGMFLGWKRMKAEEASLTSGKSAKNVGIGFLIFYGLTVLTSMGSIFTYDGFKDIIFFTFIALIPGLYLFFAGNKLSSRNKLYREYIRLIDDVGVNSIKNIGNTVNKTTENVKDDLRSMINLGFLWNHFIDDDHGLIVNKNAIKRNSEEAVTIERINVKCDSCGATSKIIKGIATECQYCHTILQG
ncbi:hypothetical protein [Alkaliphilus transvaalensis]|uniref:hypothetical protein n=1 Tax=Alkaliphilus transvaalensis TaxID=114628 RepID=UPI00047D9E39|nr:hypothetical protein [Alkaliphilus transvaalensis]